MSNEFYDALMAARQAFDNKHPEAFELIQQMVRLQYPKLDEVNVFLRSKATENLWKKENMS
ncbi:hypothetical protein [Rhizobium multihospitium]|uniref:Uncharacterized protein n=1 Tax=Rhizobium multihospitium TaxID=410764 RepID=A0A1C3WL90_9HYPH|nr:hypothetical protein [Rhizobium multihospitium]SCB40803.1 hypothetical protein GA0061103_5700 [Rhizobium multihospitium]